MAKVLGDHTQKGKKFIPPFVNQFGKNFRPVSWDNDTIPEVIWITLINADMGVQAGSEFLIDLCRNVAINEHMASHSMAMISNYDLLGEAEREKTLANFENKNLLRPIRRILGSFINTYPLCPLNFLAPAPIEQNKSEDFIQVLKTTLADLYKRNSETSIFSAAAVIYNQFVNGHMVVDPSTSLADFPEVQYYPKTEKSKKVASAILSAIKMLHNQEMFNEKSNWKKYFWDATYKLEPCKI